jgi:4'-phosphopantetheinyl transferase
MSSRESGEAGACTVWWADLAGFDERYAGLLSPAETARRAGFHRSADRDRFALGATLLRHAAAEWLRIEPEAVQVDRTCARCGAAHGKPQLLGTGLHASVTHSQSVVGVAVSQSGPVGLDAEFVSEVDWEPLTEQVLAPTEPYPSDRTAFFVYWTRKESVLKATGEGLLQPMREVVVTAPGTPPCLLAHAGCVPAASMFDLAPAAGYAAALTVLSSEAVLLTERSFTGLRTG